jgi:putative hemolysin
MRTLALRLCVVVATVALAVTAAASAADVGANDDTGKFAPDGGAAFYQRMAELGLRQTIVTVRWTPSDPLALPEEAMLDATVKAATAAGLKVVLAAYPYPPREIEAGLAKPAAFGAWLRALATRYPEVTQYVVGNEPNQPAFFRPQFVNGKQASAARFGPFLARAYDALKSANPETVVVGVGLSPRGNDKPDAKSNISTSPVRFLAALGAWYRKSKRTRPLMDGFSFHPYPNSATDPLAAGYPWPAAGFPNLDRIRQALWDAFDGTPQPTTLDGLQLYLNEVGWQVDTSSLEGYVGEENVPVTDEVTQSQVYRDLVRQATCLPDVAEVNVFGFFDDTLRTGFQAALHRADGTPRPSATAVAEEIAAGTCVQPAPPWKPARGVVGAAKPLVTTVAGGWRVRLAAGEGASVVTCVLPGRPTPLTLRGVLMAAGGGGAQCVRTAITKALPVDVVLPRLAGRQVVGARLVAETNTGRRTVVQRIVR